MQLTQQFLVKNKVFKLEVVNEQNSYMNTFRNIITLT